MEYIYGEYFEIFEIHIQLIPELKVIVVTKNSKFLYFD